MEKIFRVNAHCPYCGEEHLYTDIPLTDEEERIYDMFYAAHPNRTVFDDAWGETPLTVTRKIHCSVCDGIFSQQFRITRSIEISNMKGKLEGRQEGFVEGVLLSLRNAMENMEISVEDALIMLGVPEVDWPKYRQLLAEQ